ncbi:MAG: radical SAM protein [Candidatus Aminicenantes bacterium]|jgi:spore photoproduct lyase
MSKQKFFPKKIFVEKKSLGFPQTGTVIKNADGIPVEVINSVSTVLEDVAFAKDPVSTGKEHLLLTLQKGDFIKPCPCTPGYIGCNYFIINLDLNCPLDCTYCILQHYLTNPFLTVHVNKQDMWTQFDKFFERFKKRSFRIGTGELGDSLALDHLTENSKDLITYFRTKTNVLFELKTKTVNVKNVLAVDPAENIILSWSLNSERMAFLEEKGAPTVHQRLEAAREVCERGYRVGFHFDPILFYPGWEEGYAAVIDSLRTAIDPSRIAWISLGSLRFSPPLKPIIQKRFPNSRIIYEEMIRGIDGKFRYFRPLRLELYRKIVKFIKKGGGNKIPLYFCMENQDIWEKALGIKPRGKEDVETSLSLPLGGCR